MPFAGASPIHEAKWSSFRKRLTSGLCRKSFSVPPFLLSPLLTFGQFALSSCSEPSGCAAPRVRQSRPFRPFEGNVGSAIVVNRMPDRLSLHAPILVNTIGHCAGAIAFGILLYLFLVDWRRATVERSLLPSIAAGLAFLWNLGSLIGIATATTEDLLADTIVAISFSVLSVLPAVLLHISLRSRSAPLWITGYVVSAIAVILHIIDVITGASRFHYAAILLVTIGFAVLTATSVAREVFTGARDGGGKRLAGAMVLFLFAISFAHFGSSHDIRAWSGEAALHHAGIPLAIFVLLQDYRFLLLDAFIRFLVNGSMAALAVWLGFAAQTRLHVLEHAARDPFFAGIAFAVACLSLSLFAYLRTRAQRFLTRVVFLRSSVAKMLSRLLEIPAVNSSDTEYLAAATAVIGDLFSAKRYEMGTGSIPGRAIAVSDPARLQVPGWVQAMAPLRFARGDAHVLWLGARRGGRRYLSEDLETLERLLLTVCEQVERIRGVEIQTLVSQAELRALQAQINPHFLFNALNTLYGVIGRENVIARKLVLNLSNLFRSSFAMSSSLSPLEQELRIVRAYLEIEGLRLGSKLHTEFDIDESLLFEKVPVLSIQPLVENAVKHGVAGRHGSGFVRVTVQKQGATMVVAVSNSGAFRHDARGREGNGIGMSNVRRRLALCYGGSTELEVSTTEDETTVRFSLPLATDRVANRVTRGAVA